MLRGEKDQGVKIEAGENAPVGQFDVFFGLEQPLEIIRSVLVKRDPDIQALLCPRLEAVAITTTTDQP